jgi:hypothetical protein
LLLDRRAIGAIVQRRASRDKVDGDFQFGLLA